MGGGGTQATGNYPGKARTLDELRADLERAAALLPTNFYEQPLSIDVVKVFRLGIEADGPSPWCASLFAGSPAFNSTASKGKML